MKTVYGHQENMYMKATLNKKNGKLQLLLNKYNDI